MRKKLRSFLSPSLLPIDDLEQIQSRLDRGTPVTIISRQRTKLVPVLRMAIVEPQDSDLFRLAKPC